jgi:hypothetical protein
MESSEKSHIHYTPWSRGYTRMFESLIGPIPVAEGEMSETAKRPLCLYPIEIK